MIRRGLSLALLVLALVALPAGRAVADGSAGEFMPPSPSELVTWSQLPLYDRFPVWNYTYGVSQGVADSVNRVYLVINLMQVAKAWVVKLTIRSVEYALYFDPVTPMLAKTSEAMRTLGTLLWPETGGGLVRGGLALAGGLALWFWAWRRQREQAFRLLAGVVVLVVGAYVLLGAAPLFVSNSVGAARGVGTQVFAALAKVAAPAGTEGTAPERLLRAAGEGAWRAFVYDPWLEGEFTAGAAERPAYKDGDLEGGKWIALPPSERARQYGIGAYSGTISATARLQDFHQWSQEYQLDYLFRRFMVSGASFAVALVWSGATLLLAGGVIYYQLLLLAVLALAPLWLMLALWHPAGLRVARGALLKAVGALVSQVVLMSVLGIGLALTAPLLAVGESVGWLAQCFLLALFVFLLCRYRFAWLQWGREKPEPGVLREIALWRDRVLHRRSSTTATRETVLERPVAPPPAALPQFRVELPREAHQSSEETRAAWAGRMEAQPDSYAAELAAEMRRLQQRMRGAGGGAGAAGLTRPEILLQERVAAARAGHPEASAGAAAGSAGHGARPRSDLGETLLRFRKR